MEVSSSALLNLSRQMPDHAEQVGVTLSHTVPSLVLLLNGAVLRVEGVVMTIFSHYSIPPEACRVYYKAVYPTR